MIRKTLWRVLTVLTILSMAVPFVYAAPSTAGQAKEQQPAPPLTRPERTLLPGWAKIEPPAAQDDSLSAEPAVNDVDFAKVEPSAYASIMAATTVFTEGFEISVPPPGWTEEIVNDPGTDPDWVQLITQVHGGSYAAAFNSYTCPDNASARIFTSSLSFSATSDEYYVSFWMYHDDSYASALNEGIQIEVDDGSGWTDVGPFWQRYDASGDFWDQHIVDLSVYAGDVISLSFKGISDYGANFYIDDVQVYHQPPVPDFENSIKTADSDYDNWLITYTIDINNSGNLNATNVYLIDTIPANTGYVASSALASSGTITEGVGYLEWGGVVLSQTTEYLTFTVGILGAPLYETAITNTAWISDPMASGWVSAEVVVTTPAFVPDLSTSMKDTVPDNAYGERRAVVGTQFPYTITVSNTGVANATNAMLTDDLPTGSATYVAASAWADSGALIVASDMLTWTGVVTNGEDVQIGFMMDAISLGLSVDNTAWITGDGALLDLDAPTVGIQNPNAYCEGAIALDPSGDTFMGTIVDPDDDDAPWRSYDDVWFTVMPTATGQITFTLESPDNWRYIYVVPSDGSCGGPLVDEVYDYTYNAPAEVVVDVVYNNLYYVILYETGDYTLTLEAVYEPLQPRLDGWKDGPALVVAGDPIPYTVYAENYGEIPAAAASIVDTFPSGTVGPAMNVVVDGPGSIVANDAVGLEWNGVLAVSEGVTITFELSPTVPCLEPVMTNTAVISDPAASMAVVVEAPPVDIVIEFYLGEGFEGAFPPAGWTNEVVVATDSPTWTQETGTLHPAGYPPHGGDYMARFNSYSVNDGGAARLSSSSVDLSMATDPEVSFWMFHDDSYSTAPDRIQVQVSIDGGTVFTDVGAEILRYDSSGDFWAEHIVDLADYIGESDVIVGFLAISDYGDDLYIDDVIISSPCPAVELAMIKSGPDMVVMGEMMTYTILVENLGVVPATGVELTDYLDLGTSYAGGAFANYGTLGHRLGTLNMDIITWTGNITYGESLMLTIPVTASGECGSMVTNTVEITHTSLDAVMTDFAVTEIVGPLYYASGFELDAGGFTAQGFDLATGAPITPTWAWGDPTDGPGAAHSGDNAWATNLTGDYDDTITDTLFSPYIDLSTYTGGPLYLEYWDWRNHYANGEWAYVSISSTSSGGWVELWADHVDQQSWTAHSFDVGSIVSPGDMVQVRFAWEGNNDSSATDGWFIDDLSIYEDCPFSDLTLVKSGPDTAVIGEVMTYTVVVENNGAVLAAGVELADYLDPDTTYAGGALANYGTVDDSMGASGVISWTGDVAYGNPLMLTIPATAGGECGAIVENTVVVTHTSLGAELEDSAATMLISNEPLLAENFEGVFPPAGWTITTSTATDCDWIQGEPSDNSTGGSGYFADADSDDCGSGTTMDTELWSPQLDLSSSLLPILEFAYDYYHLGASSAAVDISTNGGITWTTIWSRDADDRGPATASIDLTPYAGSADTYIRFHYVSPGWNWWWQIDDVTIAEPWSPCSDVAIGPDQSQALCPEEGPAVYNLDVTNLTASADTINVTLEDVDWAGTTVYPTALALAAGETGVVTVTVPISMAADPGSNDAISVVAAGSVYTDRADLDTAVGLAQLWHGVEDTLLGTRYHGVAYHDGYLYQIGGETGWWVGTDAVNRYDMAADTWVTRSAMISAAYGIDAVTMGDSIYVPGGNVFDADPRLGGDFLDMLQIYTPLTDFWQLGAPMPTSLAYASAVGHDYLLYVIGGQQSDGSYTNTLHIYDPVSDTWSMGASMNEPRGYAAAGVIGGKIYVAGGAAGGVVSATNTLEIYDPVADSWSYGPDLPANWAPFGDGVKHDRYLIVFNGGTVNDSGGISNDSTEYGCSQEAWAFDTLADIWFPLPDLNRCYYGSQGDGDGDAFYLVSGRTNDGGWRMATEVEWLLQCGDCLSVDDASFTYAPPAPGVGETVTFNGAVDVGTGDIVYTWDFGDGGIGTGMDVTHVYTGAGDFVVELTVSNDCGMDVYTDTVSTMWPCESLDIDKSGPLTATSGSVIQMQVVISSAFFAPGTVLTDALPVGMEYAGNVDATEGTAWYDAGAVYWTTDEPIPEMPVADRPVKVQTGTPTRFYLFEVAENQESFEPDLGAMRMSGTEKSPRSPKYELLSPLADVVADGSFEAGTPNPFWGEASTNFGTPLCDAASCGGTGGGTGPHSGGWWTWFGGIDTADETGSVDQDVTIPVGDADLSFWLEIPTSDTSGLMEVSIDGNVLFSVTEADASTFAVYDQVVLDVSAYADGGVHNLMFEGSSTAGAITNFFVDDVMLDVVSVSTFVPITITFDVTITASSGLVTNTVDAEYCNGIVSDAHTIEVWSSCNPVTSVNFDYSPAAPETDETVTFTGMVNEGTLVLPVDYSWDFGGLIKYGNPVTNTYAISNTYPVTVEATNPCTVVPATYTGYVTVIAVDEMYYVYLPLVLK